MRTGRDTSMVCAGLIEAGWLTALVVIPLAVTPGSSSFFAKDTWVPAIAAVMLAAWLVDTASRRPAAVNLDRGVPLRPGRLWSVPLLPQVLSLVACVLLSTGLSLDPATSFWGSSLRRQGTLMILSYLAIFLLTLAYLRRPEQWRRLAGAAILTSLPVAAYGLLQALGLDPHPWGGSFKGRISSTLGNPIFLGGYLLFPIFLTGERLICHLGRRRGDAGGNDDRRRRSLPVIVGYVIALQLQLAALVLTASRGPLLGLLAGLGVIFLLAWRRPPPVLAADAADFRLRRFARAVLMLTLVLSIPGTVLLTSHAPSEDLPPSQGGRSPVVRLAQLLDLSSPTVQTRMLVWETVAGMTRHHPPIEFADGRLDSRNALRPIVGHGIETMGPVFPRFWPRQLNQLERSVTSYDRAHNQSLDLLYGIGLLGFCAAAWLFASLVLHIFGWLGLGRARLIRRQPRRQDAAALVTAVAVTAVSWGLLGRAPTLAALIPVIAVVAGLAVLILGRWQRRGGACRGDVVAVPRDRILAVLLALFVAHLIETESGIALTTARVYAWILLAALIAIGSRRLDFAAPRTTSSAEPRDRRFRRRPTSCGLLAALATVPLVHGLLIGPGVTAPGPWSRASFVAATFAVLALMLALGWTLTPNRLEVGFATRRAPSPRMAAVASGAALLALVAIVFLHLRPGLAGFHARQGAELAEAGSYAGAVTALERAVELRPHEAGALRQLADARIRNALSAAGDERRAMFESAAADLQRALRVGPLAAEAPVAMGRLQQSWGSTESDHGDREARWSTSLELFERALRLSPGRSAFLNLAAGSHALLGETERAFEVYRESLEIRPQWGETHFEIGNLHYRQAAHADQTGDERQRSHHLGEAMRAYERAAALGPRRVEALRLLVPLYTEVDRSDKAIVAASRIVKLQPESFAAYETLARLLAGSGRYGDALRYAQEAQERAPAAKQEMMGAVVRRLESLAASDGA